MSTTALTTTGSNLPAANNVMAAAEQYLESFGNKLSKTHKQQFLQICSAFGLNPFLREIYGVPFGDKFNIIVGYEVYLKRAETCGQLAGWRAWTEGDGKQMKGCIEISRRDWERPFYHEVYLTEYDQNNSMWKSKPMTMIKKVAIAQGFRLAFPVDMGGMPYTSDEIDTTPQIEATTKSHDTITRADANRIVEALKKASLAVEEVFEAFQVKRLGELEKGELDRVFDWIADNAVLPTEVVDADPEADEKQGVDGRHDLEQSFYALLAKLSDLRGEMPDDTIDNLTNGKLSCQIDIEGKPDNFIKDLIMQLENEIAKEA